MRMLAIAERTSGHFRPDNFSGSYGVGDFVTNPRNHTWLTGSVARHIAANDPREINDIAGVWLVTEDELRIWGFHEFLDIRF